ncbi:MAG: hypothetical protein ABSD85_16045, partial [Acidimicrobiales bacterium]
MIDSTKAEAAIQPRTRLIERWFPVSAVDEACGTPAGSGQNEKAIFTWFASRPIAQARAAVLCSLLEDGDEEDAELQKLVEQAVLTGSPTVLRELAARIPDIDGHRPVVLDCFCGRGIIPLEAARLGLRAVGIDWSPVAALASRLLADWALRDWTSELSVPFAADASGSDINHDGDPQILDCNVPEEKLIRDLRGYSAEVDRRVAATVGCNYPRNADGSYPWGYLWAITIPCDSCRRRFPLVGTLTLRQPYTATGDTGQSFRIAIDEKAGRWKVMVEDGLPTGQPTFVGTESRRGKSARCPFCHHNHPLDTVKAKGFAREYEDAPLLAADLITHDIVDNRGRRRRVERKTFRTLRLEEERAAVDANPAALPDFALDLSVTPQERIAPGNKDSVRGTGYGFQTFGDLMNRRQAVLFAATAHAIRSVYLDCVESGLSTDYASALASYASANLVRRLRAATRGARLQAVGKPSGNEQNRNKIGDLFINESAIGSNFDWFETGPGDGPGSWRSRSETGITPLATHIRGLTEIATPA